MIAWTIYLTFAGAVLLLLPAARSGALDRARHGCGRDSRSISQRSLPRARTSRISRTIVRVPWVPTLGMNYHLAADGISLTMTLVTGLTAVCAVLFSWKVEERPNEFFFWLLLVVAGSYGVFLSADLFLFFVFYELVIVPKYFLIAIWGSTNKEYGAMKLTLYSFFGGALVFVGILAVYATAGSLDLQQLARFQFTPQLQTWAFPVLFLGFAVLAGIWPLHTWAPTGHVAAPTAGSMLLAGIVMKLGAYGALRVALNLFPLGFEVWSKWIAVLAVIGIVYAAAVALRQSDLKFVIGYSSVSHMGFVLLGLAAGNLLGVSGAVLQMFSHGVIGALLFALAGAVYYRTHTRNLNDLSGMASQSHDAVPGVRLCHRLRRVDGHSRVQRFRRGNHDSNWCVESVPVGGLDHWTRDGAGSGIHVARLEEIVLRRRSLFRDADAGRSRACRCRLG